MWHFTSSYVVLVIAISFSEMPYLRKVYQIYSLFPSSKAILQWWGIIEVEMWIPRCSKMIQGVLMGWILENSERKPACSLSIKFSRCSLMRSRIILFIIFLAAGSTQIPLQMSHLKRVPFFGILTIIPTFYSLGKRSYSQDFRSSGSSWFAEIVRAATSNSAGAWQAQRLYCVWI